MLDIDADVLALERAIERLSTERDGKKSVKYGVLFRETADECERLSFSVFLRCRPRPLLLCSQPRTFLNNDNTIHPVEALMGTLRAAKKRGVVHYEGQLLLQGVHDDVEVVLLPQTTTSAAPEDAAVALPSPTEAVAVDAPAKS